MVNTREYNKKRFSIFESEEKTALELMNELGDVCNNVLDRTDKVEKDNNKKVSYEELHNNYQLTTDGTNANFNGSWQGLKKPTLSQEGAFAQVEKNMADIIEIKEQLEHNVQKIITPEMFGAIGDGITNDFEAIKKCFSYSNVIINFGESKIYSVDSVGIECLGDNIILNGNGSIIKISDKNIVLNTIYNSEGKEKDRTILIFNGDNVEINNLYFDANNENNYVLYNGDKYYGYQKDVDIKLPNAPDYLTIDGIIARGNNYKITNCIFDGLGNAIQCGGVWGSNVKKYNYEVKNCKFLNGFRDQITACDGENLSIISCTFRDNQRKAIQFYRNFNNGIVSKCDIKTTIGNIRLWYPTWSSSNSDAELLGIGISNPGYNDCCNYIKIENCNIDVPKNCIVARNFSKNIIIENNYLKSDDICIIMHKGLLNNFTVKNNYLQCKYAFNLYLGNI